MSASAWEGSSRAPLRTGIAAIAAIDLVLLAWFTRTAPLRAQAGPPGLLVAIGRNPSALALLVAIGVASLLAFARRFRPMVSGLIALLALAVLAEAHAALGSGHYHNFFASGAMLLGWIAGLAYAQCLRIEDDRAAERLAEAGAVALLGAIYVASGLSKLTNAGLGWADPTTLRAVVLSQHRVEGALLLDRYARFVVEHPAISRGLSGMTLLIELGGFAVLLGRRARLGWGLLAEGFHFNVFLLTPILYGEPMFLIALFTLPWPRMVAWARRRPAPPRDPVLEVEPAVARRAGMLAAGAASALTLAALGAHVVWGFPKPTPFREAGGRTSDEPRERSFHRVGPVAVGDELAGGFHVTALEIFEGHLQIETATDDDEPVTFDVASSGTQQSPFDAGGLHIVYQTTRLPFERFAAAGNDLKTRLTSTAPDLARWIADAAR